MELSREVLAGFGFAFFAFIKFILIIFNNYYQNKFINQRGLPSEPLSYMIYLLACSLDFITVL